MWNRLVSNYNYINIGGLNQPSCENVTYEIRLLDEYSWHTIYKTNIMLRCGPENIHVPQDMALAKMIKPWMDRNTLSSDKAMSSHLKRISHLELGKQHTYSQLFLDVLLDLLTSQSKLPSANLRHWDRPSKCYNLMFLFHKNCVHTDGFLR